MPRTLPLLRALGLTGLFVTAGCGATRPTLDAARPWEVAAQAVNHVALPIPVTKPDLPRPLAEEPKELSPVLKQKVTLRSDSTDIRSLLLGLSKQTGLNIVLDDDVEGNVSAYLNDVEVLEALKRIAGPLGYELEVKPNYVRVFAPTVETRIYRLQYLRGERKGESTVSMMDRSATGGQIGQTTGAGGTTGGATGGMTMGGTAGAPGSPGSLGNASMSSLTSKFDVDFWEDLGSELETLIFDGANADDLVKNDRKEGGISIYERADVPKKDAAAAPGDAKDEPPPPTDEPKHQRPKQGRSLTIDSMSGTIVVRAKPDVLDQVGRYLDLIRETVQRQVVIDVRILEVSLDDEKHFGIDTKDLPLLPSDMLSSLGLDTLFGEGGAPRITTPSGFPDPVNGNPVTDALYPALTQKVPPYGFVVGKSSPTGDEYKVIVSALAKLGDVKVVSAPRVTALHNQKAMVKIVRDRVYFLMQAGSTSLSNAGSASTGAQFYPVVVPEGVVVDMTPLIDDDGSVTLEVHPSFSVIFDEKEAPQGQGSQPEVERREFDTTLHVEGGQTVVLGGLVTERTTRQESGLPYLKDIPYLGALFRHTDDVIDKSEIIVLLTPHVQGPDLAKDMINHQAEMMGAPLPYPGEKPAGDAKSK